MLSDTQNVFAKKLAEFILKASDMGYCVSIGEVYRPPETAKMYEAQGKGIANSLHCLKLAADLNFFRNGVLLISFEDIRPLGELWESFSSHQYPCNWGGRFSKQDCDHFSLSIDHRR